jgi:hypothetical protein
LGRGDKRRKSFREWPTVRRLAGVDSATVKELMGHSSITTTMRYVHPTPEHKRRGMEQLERFNVEKVFARIEDTEFPTKVPTVTPSGDFHALVNC